MSLSITLFNALSALNTNQNALSVTSGNVANVNTPDYSRKVHEQQNRVIAGMGMGVETAQITRKVDQFLRSDIISELTTLADAELRAEFFARTQEMFGSPGNNNALNNVITDLAVAMESVANNPELAATRFTAVAEVDRVARQIRDMADQIQTLRGQADREIASAVVSVNEALQNIADLNVEISQNLAKGLPTGDLEDARDTALKTVSEHLEINDFIASDGQMTVVTTAGRLLVGGSTAATMAYTSSSTMTASQSYPANIDSIDVNGSDITTSLTNGKLAALVGMRDDILPAMTEELDQLTAMMRDQLNRVHNRGANTPLGNGQTATDAPVMYGTREFAGAGDAITLGSDVVFQILDANGDPATLPMTLSAGATTIGAATTAIDTYLDSGIDFGEAALVNNRLEIKMEAGYRLAILDQGPTADAGDATVTFGGDSYLGFSNFLGLNNLYNTPELTTGNPVMANQGTQLGISSTITIRADLVTNPDYLSRGTLQGTSPNFTLGAGDNEIAQQLAEAFAINQTYAAVTNGPPQTTTTFSGYAATILSDNAARASAAEDTLTFQTAFFENLENKFQSEIGVNLDEELANMVVFQNAFNAAARLVQAVDELFDVLLRL